MHANNCHLVLRPLVDTSPQPGINHAFTRSKAGSLPQRRQQRDLIPLICPKEPQEIKCPETKGRYVLLRALSEHGGKNFATVAELGVIGE